MNFGEGERHHWSRAMSGAAIGFISAIGTLGGVLINLTLRQSYLSTGSETTAFCFFLVCYLSGAVITWAMYVRRPSAASSTVVAVDAGAELAAAEG
jgi:NNP family nitrate/nitrite transporter-like MFS transporter